MKSNWFQISLPVQPEISEAVSNYLFEIGASGIEENDGSVVAYFSNTENRDTMVNSIQEYLKSLQEMGYSVVAEKEDIHIADIEDRDWNAEWKKQFVPFLVTPSVMIKPTWCELPSEHPKVVIELDPEMAFGTGTHATTALSALLLEDKVDGKTLLDAGTGTGILAMIALLLGAKSCVAFDVDPLAVETARNNAGKNSVESLSLFTGTIENVQKNKFDIITANINSGQLLGMMKAFNDFLKDDGLLILSGILDTEEKKLTDALIQNGFKVKQILHREEWLAFECVKS